MLERMQRKGNPPTLLLGMYVGQLLWGTAWIFLRKLKIGLPYDGATPFLEIYPDKTIIQNDTCTPMFIAEQFTIAKTWKQLKCLSSDEWIKKKWYIHTMNSTQP